MLNKKIFIQSLVISLIVSIVSTFIINQLNIISGVSLSEVASVLFAVAFVSAIVTSGWYARSGEYGDDIGREVGTVKWFNGTKGYGFITRESGEDVFVHYRSIRGKGHRSLVEGQNVRFNVSQGDKGLQADDVSVAY